MKMRAQAGLEKISGQGIEAIFGRLSTGSNRFTEPASSDKKGNSTSSKGYSQTLAVYPERQREGYVRTSDIYPEQQRLSEFRKTEGEFSWFQSSHHGTTENHHLSEKLLGIVGLLLGNSGGKRSDSSL
jgi:hypothetical protein